MLASIFAGSYESELYVLFGVIVVTFLIIDLGILNREAKVISQRSALLQSIFWVSISMVFAIIIYFWGGGYEDSMIFLSAYFAEKALSVDNIFVIILILRYFKVENEYYHKILFWGILGALVFRGTFIFLGDFLVERYHWILYLFGAFLVYSGVKIYFDEDDFEIEPERNPFIRFARKFLRVTKSNYGGKFFFWKSGGLYFTPLFLVVMLIESTDLIFAVDSIPVAFGITTNEFLIYTSNIFAVMGLRAMFFLLANVMHKFHLLQKGLSIVLIFIGAKMLLDIFGIDIAPLWSFLVVILTLTASIVLSLYIKNPNPEEEEPALMTDAEEQPENKKDQSASTGMAKTNPTVS